MVDSSERLSTSLPGAKCGVTFGVIERGVFVIEIMVIFLLFFNKNVLFSSLQQS